MRRLFRNEYRGCVVFFFCRYIIVDGKVWITDLRRRWCYTLKGGESFGEVCMVYGTRRTFNAFAGSTVEVFAITREDYVHILLRYVGPGRHKS